MGLTGNFLLTPSIFWFQEQQKLRRDLIDEVKARKSLENVLKKYIKVPPSPSPQLVPPDREKDDHT